MLFLLPLLFLSSCRGSADPVARQGGALPREETVRFKSGGATLEGTLYRPDSAADSPAVVLLAGSDRSARGPLRVGIAKHLAAHGVAALVYDSPGTGASSGDAALQTRAERVDEALAAVERLRGMEGIRPKAVGVFGGSEGADIAVLSAARDPKIASVVAVSGSLGVSLLDVARHSAEKRGQEAGLDPEEIAQAVAFKELLFVVLSGVDLLEWPVVEARAKVWKDDGWSALIEVAKQRARPATPERSRVVFESLKDAVSRFQGRRWYGAADPGNALAQLLAMDGERFAALMDSGRFSQNWERAMPDLSSLRCPVLAVWGEEDSFLPPHQSAARLRKALEDAHHPDFEIQIFPGATHFLTVRGSTTEFAPGYLEAVTEWLNRRGRAEGG